MIVRIGRRSASVGRDVTKTAAYAYTELALKAVSAIGLVLIGAAGWWFQFSTREAEKGRQVAERQAKAQLAALRGYAELEVASSRIATLAIRRPAVAERIVILRDANERVHASAAALGTIGPDPVLPISLPLLGNYNFSPETREFAIGEMATALADITDVVILAVAIDASEPDKAWSVRVASTKLVKGGLHTAMVASEVERADNYVSSSWHSRTVSESMVKFWRVWNNSGPKIEVETLDSALPLLARAVQKQAVVAAQRVLRQHPELTEAYVGLRGTLYAEASKDSGGE